MQINRFLSSLFACLSLILFWLLGQTLSYWVPLPGTLLGLLLLFLGLLWIKNVPLALQRVSQFSLRHLSLFFISPLVAAWFYVEQLPDKLWLFLLGLVISTFLSFWLTAWLGQRLLAKNTDTDEVQGDR